MKSELTLLRRSTVETLMTLSCQSGLTISRRTLACAAELVEYFSNWRKFKMTNHRTEWVYQPIKRIVEDFMGQFGRWVIGNAINFLLDLGVLERRRNPGNAQDRTYQYRICIGKFKTDSPKSQIRSASANFSKYQQISNTEIESTSIKTSAAGVCEVFSVEEGKDDREVEELDPPQKGSESAKTQIEKTDTQQEFGEGNFSAPETDAIFDELESVGVVINPQLEQVVRTSELIALTTAIQILKAKRRRGDRLTNPAGFFIRAVRERWQPEPEESGSIAPPGFSRWFDAANSAGLVTHSCRGDDGSIVVLTSGDQWQPFEKMAALYPLDVLY